MPRKPLKTKEKTAIRALFCEIKSTKSEMTGTFCEKGCTFFAVTTPFCA
jgi:hypothetical protein